MTKTHSKGYIYNENGETMEDERVNVNLEDFNKTEGLIILPYISDNNQRSLIGIYLQELFNTDNDTSNYNYINAENALILATLELCTNIKLVEDSKALFSLNDVFYNIKSVNEIFSKIRNYEHFLDRLHETVKMVREERRLEKSLGSVVEGLYFKGMSLLDAFENLDADKIKDMLSELEKSPILKDSIEIFKNQKSAKPE